MSGTQRLCSGLAVAAGIAVTALGAATLTAWSVGRSDLLRLPADSHPLTPYSAVALTAMGLALLLLAPGRPGGARLLLGRLLGLLVVAVGLTALAEHLTGAPLRPAHVTLDRLLGPDSTSTEPPPVLAALCYVFFGTALTAFDVGLHRRLNWPQVLAPATTAVGLVIAVQHAFHESGLVDRTQHVMPFLVAVGLFLAGLGTMLARVHEGLLRPFTSPGPGGIVARRLAPAMLLLPFAVALLGFATARLGVRRPAVVLALGSALFALVVMLIIARIVRVLDEADHRQGHLLQALAGERDFITTLLQSLEEGVVVFDRDLRVLDANSRWCQLVGLSRADVVGRRPPYPWQPPDEPAALAFGGGAGGGDRTIRRADGTLVPVLTSMAPVLDDEGRPRAFVASYVDISGRKQAEDALASRAAELERVNHHLTHTNRQLADAVEFKGDLMSMVSHEVSQPLSSVASLSELLSAGWTDLPDDTRQELAEKIDRNTRRLTTMVTDMLLLLRLDAGIVSARPAPVPVAEVVETVTGALGAATEISATIDPGICALADREHLWQVLSNLVENARQHGAPPIEVTAEPSADGVAIAVRDHGEGIPPEFVPRLFERFTRMGDQASRRKGSGLGLFIVRHLVEVNGGSIRYEQAEPQGARLVIILPPAARSVPVPQPAP